MRRAGMADAFTPIQAAGTERKPIASRFQALMVPIASVRSTRSRSLNSALRAS